MFTDESSFKLFETVCGNMAATVYADPEQPTLNTIKRQLRKAWKSIPLKTLQNLIGSMPDRLETVLNSKGETIKY